MKNKYDWDAMNIPEQEVRAGLPLTKVALGDHRRVGAAFIWAETPQGHDFWSGYMEGRDLELGRKYLQEMLDQLSD